MEVQAKKEIQCEVHFFIPESDGVAIHSESFMCEFSSLKMLIAANKISNEYGKQFSYQLSTPMFGGLVIANYNAKTAILKLEKYYLEAVADMRKLVGGK